jgi:hypothetical protein
MQLANGESLSSPLPGRVLMVVGQTFWSTKRCDAWRCTNCPGSLAPYRVTLPTSSPVSDSTHPFAIR